MVPDDPNAMGAGALFPGLGASAVLPRRRGDDMLMFGAKPRFDDPYIHIL